jgi:PTH1 family peptidyl-tRNA hydrolase
MVQIIGSFPVSRTFDLPRCAWRNHTGVLALKSCVQKHSASMKFLITGLGNPGPAYHYTRHNIGFMVLGSARRTRMGVCLRPRPTGRYLHHPAQGQSSYFLLKPSTYMNLSGKAVRYHLQKHGTSNPKRTARNHGRFGAAVWKNQDSRQRFRRWSQRTWEYSGGAWPRKLCRACDLALAANFQQRRTGGLCFERLSCQKKRRLCRHLLDKMGDAILGFATIGLERTMNIYNG